MPKISLTDFVDVVVRSGTPKMTKVAAIKHRPPYHPAQDFYKPIREGLADTHRTGLGKGSLQTLLGNLSDPKKRTNYPEVVAGYTKWWGRKNLAWFEPPSGLFSSSGFDVTVNPELGLEVNGAPHVVKLYFKGDQLSKQRVDLVTAMLEHELQATAPPGTTFAILDTRTAKIFTGGASTAPLIAGLRAELAYIASLWAQV